MRMMYGLILALAVLFCAACHRKDVQTLGVHVPTMNTDACAALIQNEFMTKEGSVEGILKVEPDVANRMVYVTYDSRKIAIKNIEYTICHLGFEANGNMPKPHEVNRLPSECR